MADSIWKQGLDALTQVAPTLASMIGGPLAGTAVSALEKVFGLDPNGDKNAALAAVANATPEQLLELKKEDNRHAEALEQMGIDQEKIAQADRASAREREAAVKDWMPQILGTLVILGAGATAFLLFTGKIVGVNDPVESLTIGTVIGYIFNEMKQVLAYYFGSSASSKEKDLTIGKLTRGS